MTTDPMRSAADHPGDGKTGRPDVHKKRDQAVMTDLKNRRNGQANHWSAADIKAIAGSGDTLTCLLAKTFMTQGPVRDAFVGLVSYLRDELNPAVSESEALELLAHYMLMRPVLDDVCGSHLWAKNRTSRAMDIVLEQLRHDEPCVGQTQNLDRFHSSVRRRAAQVTTPQDRQAFMLELYERFFRTAFPMQTQRLGIVYTPLVVVDFMIQSMNDSLKAQFGVTAGTKGVTILDPFAGIGPFITRLLQSGLIAPEEMAYKYDHEIKANEILLLAHYIASINIEAVYHEQMRTSLGREIAYRPFRGLRLVDTFAECGP